jgi:hypothetical protein
LYTYSFSLVLPGLYFCTKIVKGTPVVQLVQLVESFRNPEGQPRQHILTSLGDSRLLEDAGLHPAQAATAQRDDDKYSQASKVLENSILKTDHTPDAVQTW